MVARPADAALMTPAGELVVSVPWREALAVFLDRQSSPGTRKAYEAAVREACEWLGAEHVSDMAPGDLARYRAHLVARTAECATDKLSPGSVALRLAALRGFLSFCRLTGATQIPREVVQFTLAGFTSKVVRPYEVLSEQEQQRVLEHLLDSRAESAERDYALLALMLGTGLRAAEVCRLQVGDVLVDDDGDWGVRVRQGKGRKDRLVPLGQSVRAILREWLELSGRSLGNPKQAASYVFFGQGGVYVPLTTRRLQDVVRTAVRGAGITEKAITPHSLRHSMAMGLFHNGADVITVQKLLGHASVQTTQKYLDHIGYKELKRWAVEL